VPRAKRRAHGEGSIFLRSDGRYSAVISLGVSPDGRRIRRTVYGRTQAEVVTELLRLRGADAAGLDVRADRSTLGGYLASWLDLHEGSVRVTTMRAYRRRADIITRHIGALRLVDLDADDITSFLKRLVQREGLALLTVRDIRALLCQALEPAVEKGKLARNPASMSKLPAQGDPREVEPLTEEQTRTVLAALRTMKPSRTGVPLGPLFSVILTAGLRKGEARGLTAGALDLETSTLRIRTQLQDYSDDEAEAVRAMKRQPEEFVRWVSDRCALVKVKSAAGKRDLVLLPYVVEMLRPLVEGRPPDALVFTMADGSPVPERGVGSAWSRILRELGMPHKRVHDARHGAGSLLIEQGVDNKVVAAVLGHSDPSMTQRVYLHVRRKGMEQAAEAMARAIKPPAGD